MLLINRLDPFPYDLFLHKPRAEKKTRMVKTVYMLPNQLRTMNGKKVIRRESDTPFG